MILNLLQNKIEKAYLYHRIVVLSLRGRWLHIELTDYCKRKILK